MYPFQTWRDRTQRQTRATGPCGRSCHIASTTDASGNIIVFRHRRPCSWLCGYANSGYDDVTTTIARANNPIVIPRNNTAVHAPPTGTHNNIVYDVQPRGVEAPYWGRVASYLGRSTKSSIERGNPAVFSSFVSLLRDLHVLILQDCRYVLHAMRLVCSVRGHQFSRVYENIPKRAEKVFTSRVHGTEVSCTDTVRLVITSWQVYGGVPFDREQRCRTYRSYHEALACDVTCNLPSWRAITEVSSFPKISCGATRIGKTAVRPVRMIHDVVRPSVIGFPTLT